MTSKILFLILMSAFFFVPMILHRSRRQFMTRFYLRMTALVTARKLYRLMLLILLYVFHFLVLSRSKATLMSDLIVLVASW